MIKLRRLSVKPDQAQISGNRIIGSFKDTNGTVAQYTGVK